MAYNMRQTRAGQGQPYAERPYSYPQQNAYGGQQHSNPFDTQASISLPNPHEVGPGTPPGPRSRHVYQFSTPTGAQPSSGSDYISHGSENLPAAGSSYSLAGSGFDHQAPPESESASLLDHDRVQTSIDFGHPSGSIHYGNLPSRMPRRYKLKDTEIPLFRGNPIAQQRVPPSLLEKCKEKSGEEFNFLRYTPATCEPDAFEKERYTLRPALYEPRRETEMFIVITMCTENVDLFETTMSAVFDNIAYLCEHSRSFGPEGWKKIVVCIVSDGREKINKKTLAAIAAMGAYQSGVGSNTVKATAEGLSLEKPVTAHIYEYTSQLTIKGRAVGSSPVPCQIIFCLKEKNKKKINSHRWFFSAFAPILKPDICVLIDVGTEPGKGSIYELWKAFHTVTNIGGACGQIVALKGQYWKNLLNPLVAAQNFEYKMSNILDKPLESAFGYITVLPGAYSAYRYRAIQNDEHGEGPLKQYFYGETIEERSAPASDNSVFDDVNALLFAANMYLAEDRILCWELVTKPGDDGWVLHYVSSARAVTDVPDTAAALIKQRRRWLNGSFFAALHAIRHIGYIRRSSHGTGRKILILIDMIYQMINQLFAWFALANYYISFVILMESLNGLALSKFVKDLSAVLHYFYLALLIACFLLALGNKPDGYKRAYIFALCGFGVVTLYMTIAAIVLAFKGIQNIVTNNTGRLSIEVFLGDQIFRFIVLSILSTIGLYIAASLLFLDPWHMVTSFLQYTLMAPSYINVLNVFAFANVDDVTWGTPSAGEEVATDLGAASANEDTQKASIVLPATEGDVDQAYREALDLMREEEPRDAPPRKPTRDEIKAKLTELRKIFRTNVNLICFEVLLAWALSNGLLAVVVIYVTDKISIDPTTGTSSVNGYMVFLLVSVAALALFRFCGALAYVVIRMFVYTR